MAPSDTVLIPLSLHCAIVRNFRVASPATGLEDAIAQLADFENRPKKPAVTSTSQSDPLALAPETRSRTPDSGCLLVVEQEQLVGILTQTDVVGILAQQQPLDRLTLDQVMVHPVITLSETEAEGDLGVALRLLQQHRIGHLPVVDAHDRPLGVITQTSLLQALNSPAIDQRPNPAQPSPPEQRTLKPTQPTPPLPCDRATQALERLNRELEQKVAERTAALQASEERWQLALKGSNDGIWDWDVANDRVFFSSRWKAIRGLAETPGDNRIETWFQEIHPEDRVRVRAAIEAHFVGQTEFLEMEYRVCRPEGTVIWVLDRGQAQRDSTGRVVRMIGSETDITARKQTEQALRASQRRDATLAAVAPVAIFRFDAPLNCIYVSDRWAEMTGRPAKSALGRGWLEALHPDDRETLLAQWQNEFSQPRDQQQPFNCCEGRHIRPDGRISWFYCQVVPELDADGQTIGYIGTLTDITDRKQAEQENQRLQDRLQFLLSASPAVTFTCEPGEGYALTFISDNIQRVTGHRAANFLADPQYWANHLHPEDAPRIFADLPQLFEQGHHSHEYRFRYQDGTYRWVRNELRLIRDRQGNPLEVAGYLIDVHDRKQVETQLQALSDRLTFALQAGKLGTWDWEFQHEATWDERMYEIYGLQNLGRPAVYQDWLDRVHPEDVKAVDAQLQAAARGEGDFDVEFRAWRTDGELRWVRAMGVLQRDRQGNPIRMTGLNQDITELRRTEQENRRLKDRLEFLLASSPAMIYSCQPNEDYRATFVSGNVQTILGYRSEEFLADPRFWASRIHPEDAPRVLAEIPALFVNNTHKHEYRFLHQDGHYVWLRDECRLVRDGQNQPIEIIGYFADISDLKQTEAALQESQYFIQQVAEASPNILYLYDCREQRNLYVNRGITTILGYTPQAVQEMGSALFPTIMHPEDLARVPAQLERIFQAQDGEILEFEYRMRHANGQWRWLYGRDTVFSRDAQGRVIQTIGTAQDITDRKRIEAELAASETKFRHLVEGVNDVLWAVDQAGLYTYLSPQFKTCFGWEPEEWLRKSLLELVHPDDRPLLLAIQQQTIELGDKAPDPSQLPLPNQSQTNSQTTSQNCQFRHRHRSGHYVWVRSSYAPVQDEAGMVIGIQGILSDISDLKQAELALQASETCFRQVFTSNIVGMMFADFRGRITEANDRFLAMLGYTRADLEAERLNWYQLTPPEYQEKDQQVIEHLKRYRSIEPWEKEYYRKDGSRLAILVAVALLSETDDNCVCVVLDISDRKRYEAQLQRTNEELARATRLKDEFLANMSHELRTPLNAILGLTEGLQEQVFGPLNPTQLKTLGTIERSGSHLLELINDILDVAKIEAGQIELHCAPTSVFTLCQSSLTFIKQQAQKKQIQVEIKLPLNVPDLWVDERRIRQVLINLLNNAVKFTPVDGRITLEVLSLPPEPSGAPFLRIAIGDTGIGIAPEHLDRLFQPFVQIDSALNRQYTGTGLGLALVKRIVELHGGQVGVTSEVGVGSCFTIDLPCVAEPRVQRQLEALPAPCLNLPNLSEPVSSPLILLAEDNEANMMTVSSYLTAKGYRVLWANNGQTAIDLARSQHPDLILMDIQMPGLDGLEAMRQIRRDRALATVPIIALTALAMSDDQERCLTAGATDYLSKPVSLQHLVTRITQLLALHLDQSHPDQNADPSVH